MTTEIAILNRQAVALAADSAATVGLPAGTQKIYTSANKIFGLSRRHPVAVMIYNAGAFMGVPWETIVKLFRDNLADNAYSTVNDYLVEFIADLTKKPKYCPPELQQAWLLAMARAEMTAGFNALRELVEQALAGAGDQGIDDAELSRIAIDLVNARLNVLRAAEQIDQGWTSADFRVRYDTELVALRDSIFGQLPLSDEALSLFIEAAAENITRRHQSTACSGIVVAGFGDDEIYPALAEQIVDGVVDGHLRAWPRASHDVGAEEAAIVPFAQDDMIKAFVTGVSPTYQEVVENVIGGLVEGYPAALFAEAKIVSAKSRAALDGAHATVAPQKVQEALLTLSEWRSETFVAELLEIVSALPKEELAALAEALVSLTSLKRRMSRQAETVGGPVDVAVISKGDGLIWIKRKHYFEPHLNPQYLANKYGSA